MKKTVFAMGLAAYSILSGCGNDNEDQVQNVNKDGSVETAISLRHLDNYDLLTTTHKIWVKGRLHKTTSTTDTLPTLGQKREVVENSEGHVKVMPLQKEYELYITVK